MSFDLPHEEVRAQAFLLTSQTTGNDAGRTDRVPIELKEFRLKGFPGQEIQLGLEAEGYWGTTHHLVTEPGEQSLAMALYRAGRLRAELVPAPGEELPDSLEMTLETSAKAAGTAEARPIPSSRQTCPVANGRIDCPLPAGRLDLRLNVEGHAPLYLWDVAVLPGQATEAGAHTLRRGGSVVGRLEEAGGGWGESPPEVRLEASTARASGSPAEQTQLDRLRLVAAAGPDGFFVLIGVPAGEYRLRAEHPSAGTATSFPVVVREGRETRISEAVELHSPASLEVRAFPATSPQGLPWEVTVLAMQPDGGSVRRQVQGRLSPEGSWSSEPMEAGPYKIVLQGADGSRWAERDVTLSGRPEPVELFLDAVEVEGNLTLAGLPIQGTLWFGGRRGMTHVRVATDGGSPFGLVRRLLKTPGQPFSAAC